MNASMIFSICSFFYILLISFVYFFRKKIKNQENIIYSIMLITCVIGVLLEISSTFLHVFVQNCSFLKNLSLKLIICFFFTWLFEFTTYIYIVSCKKIEEKEVKFGSFIYFLSALIILVLPVYKKIENGKISYVYGPSVNFLYVLFILLIIFCLFMVFKNRKKISKKKIIPLFVFILVGTLVVIVQTIFPYLLLVASLDIYITILMYHTIENPDVKMINQLEFAKESADKANAAKTDFLSSMSHEIRTPLNAIVGFSDEIMECNNLEEAKENAKDIVNASQTLLEIVNGILDISKIEAGKLEIVNSPYDANDTFTELAKLITPKMNEKGLDFSFNIAPDLPKTLYGDHANLKKVVTNLLSNACKYTDKGYVHYEVNCVNSKDLCKLIISVEDSGRGIKTENVDKLFTKFQRLEEDRNTTIEGTGLGLAITKQLVELMGGRIIVHTVYGEGSKFTIVLNQKITADVVKKEREVKTTLDLHDVKILVVDDVDLNLKVAKKLLERYNANLVDTCDSGFECLEKIKAGEKYNVILLDDMMPKMSGVDTLKKLKEIPGFRIPVIALTANAISGMKEKYLADGFDDYLAKPIEKDQLIQVLNEILGRSYTEELAIKEAAENELEEKKEELDKIVPVEENIEAVLGDQLDRNYVEPKEEIETLDLEEESVPETSEKLGREYLEANGVDVNHGLELLGDMDMYNMTINDFMAEVEDKWNRIVEYKNSGDMENYSIEVHSLKSDCKYLGFMTLADVAYQHELKSKENDSTFVNDNFKELEDEYHKVLEVASKYVESNPVSDE